MGAYNSCNLRLCRAPWNLGLTGNVCTQSSMLCEQCGMRIGNHVTVEQGSLHLPLARQLPCMALHCPMQLGRRCTNITYRDLNASRSAELRETS